MQNKPNWPPGRDTPAFHHSIIPPFQARCRSYKQSQTWASWDIWGTRRGRPSKCARQTQVPGGPCPTIPPRCRLYKQQTNPILRFLTGDCGLGTDLGRDATPAACHLWPARAGCQTNPIWSGSGVRDLPRPGNAWRRLPACAGMTLLRTGLLRQTNPIWGRMKRGTSAVRIRSCDELGAPAALKKQSQKAEVSGQSPVDKRTNKAEFEVCRVMPDAI
jgi:hypothetical protein